jgi:hypothetical protein
LQDNPDFLPALLGLAISNALAGRLAEAKTVMSRALQINPSLSISKLPLLNVLRRPEDLSSYSEGARMAGLPE